MSALTKLTDEQLEKMAKSPLSEADNNSIAELRKIIRLLGEQSKDLIAYLETQKPAPLERFQQHRADTWKQIVRVLKLDENAAQIEKNVKGLRRQN